MDLWFDCRESIKRKKIRPCAGFSDTTSFKFDIFDILRQRIEFVYEHLHEMKPGRVPPSAQIVLQHSIHFYILYLIIPYLRSFILIYFIYCYFSLFLLFSVLFWTHLHRLQPPQLFSRSIRSRGRSMNRQ